jgi:hypothetical protein
VDLSVVHSLVATVTAVDSIPEFCLVWLACFFLTAKVEFVLNVGMTSALAAWLYDAPSKVVRTSTYRAKGLVVPLSLARMI